MHELIIYIPYYYFPFPILSLTFMVFDNSNDLVAMMSVAAPSPPPTPGGPKESNLSRGHDSSGSKRPRSRTGCFTCRKRKKRCDEVRPLCGACSRLQLECTYPAPGTERKNKRRKSITAADAVEESSSSTDKQQHPNKSTTAKKSNNTTNNDNNSTNNQLILASSRPNSPQFISTLSPSTYEQIFGHFEDFDLGLASIPEAPDKEHELIAAAPTIPASPTTWYALQLDPLGHQLFDYFRDKLAKLICVSNEDSNSFLNVFVPMAQEDSAVLYSLVAWAGFHKDKGQLQDTALFYLNKALQNVKPVTTHTSLASMLLICAAEICSGDVMHWDKHLSATANMMKKYGGIDRFLNDRSLRWLASNFAYHDLLASSTCARNTHFPSIEYDKIMKHGFGLDALIGCCQPLFKILAEISELAVDSQRAVEIEDLREIKFRSATLERKLESSHPDPLDMIQLDADELEQQLTMFETFQLTARLHLRQAVLRMNSASIEMQCLCQDLLNCLDRVLETRVEGGLVFPMFIAGINCIKLDTRELMSIKFERYYERNMARNIKRARHLMEEVWSRDDFGTKHVDWYGVIQNRGWDICFA